MDSYRKCAIEGASAVDLVVALYDGIVDFLRSAADATDRGDVRGRRIAAKRALDIIIHLQAHLRMDIGGSPALALSEFYASMFAKVLQASHAASRQKFEDAIHCVQNVREAWKKIAQDCAGTGCPSPLAAPTRSIYEEKAPSDCQLTSSVRWTA